jgi:hypothetical protein
MSEDGIESWRSDCIRIRLGLKLSSEELRP